MHAFLFYQYNENLLIQFILHEALNTHKHLQDVSQVAYDKIAQLNTRMCPFNPLGSMGTIQKMEYYCKLIHVVPGLENILLLELLEKSILLAGDKKDELFRNCFSKITTLLYSFLVSFKHEETVLFYLLKNQKRLDLMFGNNAVSNFFNNHVEIDVFQRYKERGFQELTPLIEKYLQELRI